MQALVHRFLYFFPLFWLIVLYPFAGQGYNSIIPDVHNPESHPKTKALAEKVGAYVDQYVDAMEKVPKFYFFRASTVLAFYYVFLQHCLYMVWIFSSFAIGFHFSWGEHILLW